MSELLFIRHAQTDLAGTFCGHTDAPVNEMGRKQIAVLLEGLKDETIDRVYSSDLLRAHTTAKALAEERSVPVIALAKLREIYFGDWEGLTWAQIEQCDPDYARRWMSEFPRLAAPNGETLQEFEDRVINACAKIAQRSDAGTTAIVTHAGVMRVMLQRFRGLNEEQSWRGTAQYCCSFRLEPALLVPEIRR